MTVFAADGATADFDKVIICTGHHWPMDNKMPGTNHFESPYPPLKLGSLINMPVRIKGSSLTAVDAMRTIARVNGEFKRDAYGFLSFIPHSAADRFQLQLYSRHGILPGLRFHLEDPHLSRKNLLTKEALTQHRKENDGFVSLDFIFEHNFKKQFRTIDPTFFELIKDWKVEDFVGAALASFSSDDPFTLFEEEYRDAMASIRNKKSEFWKEKLAILSVGMNYPAKYLSAEDKIRFDEFLMPLIAVVIAFIPQQSAEEIIALRKAGRLFMNVSGNEQVDENEAFIDCTGQPRLWINDFPFQDLVSSGSVSQARLRYQFQDKELDVPGLAITDAFRAITIHGNPHPGLYIMAVPYIGGFNPDYSGLDFCEDAAKAIVADLAERDQ